MVGMRRSRSQSPAEVRKFSQAVFFCVFYFSTYFCISTFVYFVFLSSTKVIKAAMSSRGDLKVSQKSCATDLVTETDKAVEKLLVETIAAKFPDHK